MTGNTTPDSLPPTDDTRQSPLKALPQLCSLQYLYAARRLTHLGSGPPAHGILWVSCPGIVNSITPPQIHMSLEVSSSAGMLHNITVFCPGIQGAGVAGIHGAGVGVPKAAAVAAITAGFAGDLHMANGMMFVMGMWSIIFAAIM